MGSLCLFSAVADHPQGRGQQHEGESNAQPTFRQAMGDAAYQRVLVRHDIDTEAAKLAGYFAGAGL